MFSKKKKTVLVTGSSTGIGEATTKFLAQKGWTVFAGVRKEADAQKLRSIDINIKPVILDVTKEDQVRSAIEEIKVAVGGDGLDALVNNAGLTAFGPIEFTSWEDVMLQFDVNLFGVIRMIQAAMPLIRMGVPGRVINVGSVITDYKFPYMGVYGATKSALVAITESLRREVAMFGIKVTLLQLGPVKTGIVETSSKKLEATKSETTEGSDVEKYYHKVSNKLTTLMSAAINSGVDVTRVARRVHQILNADYPKNLYNDSWTTWWNVKKAQWMPYTWHDSAIDSSLRIKE